MPREEEEEEIIVTSRQVGPWDVLMGRGARITENAGNARLRQMVAERYRACARSQRHKEKHEVAVRIVRDIEAGGGRFLRKLEAAAAAVGEDHPAVAASGSSSSNAAKQETQSSRWIVVKDHKVILVKVKQLLRDMGPQAQEKRLERQRYRYRKLGAKSNDPIRIPNRRHESPMMMMVLLLMSIE